jgi:hypothetical protein
VGTLPSSGNGGRRSSRRCWWGVERIWTAHDSGHPLIFLFPLSGATGFDKRGAIVHVVI